MAAPNLRPAFSTPELPRYTLIFRNGEILRHQDPLAVAQYRADARLAQIHPEGPQIV